MRLQERFYPTLIPKTIYTTVQKIVIRDTLGTNEVPEVIKLKKGHRINIQWLLLCY